MPPAPIRFRHKDFYCLKVLASRVDKARSRRNEEEATAIPITQNERFLMSIRALIVDDSSVMRKIVERSLRQAGIDLSQVFEAGNGADALGVPAVPNAKDVPVVMITTEGSEAHVVQALSCGARGYIRKPFTPDQVKEHVVPVLGGKS